MGWLLSIPGMILLQYTFHLPRQGHHGLVPPDHLPPSGPQCGIPGSRQGPHAASWGMVGFMMDDVWLGLWNMNGLWSSIQLGMSSSQLTKSIIFHRGRYLVGYMWIMWIYVDKPWFFFYNFKFHRNHHEKNDGDDVERDKPSFLSTLSFTFGRITIVI
jgi:hypothetical protein